MLPASYAVAKELLPVFDRPSIDWVVAEALAAGVERIILVSSRGKPGLMDHFDRHPHLETMLNGSGKTALAEQIKERAQAASFIEVRQGEALGLGHAVLCAAAACSDDRVAVLLPDDLYFGAPPALADLIAASDKAPQKGVIGLLQVEPEETRKYGMVGGRWDGAVMTIDRLVEKPAPEDAPSAMAITGRYVLPASIFAELRAQGSGALGEIQLTDALQRLARGAGMLGVIPRARRFDAGDHGGLLVASLRCGLDYGDPELRQRLTAEINR
jgi:UTP--glucose-1-phosphate uridylyltransferase